MLSTLKFFTAGDHRDADPLWKTRTTSRRFLNHSHRHKGEKTNSEGASKPHGIAPKLSTGHTYYRTLPGTPPTPISERLSGTHEGERTNRKGASMLQYISVMVNVGPISYINFTVSLDHSHLDNGKKANEERRKGSPSHKHTMKSKH